MQVVIMMDLFSGLAKNDALMHLHHSTVQYTVLNNMKSSTHSWYNGSALDL